MNDVELFRGALGSRVVSTEDRSDSLMRRLRFTFTNGYGISIVQGGFSYGASDGLYEIAVLGKDGSISYATPITGDVIGYLTVPEVFDYMKQISELS